MSANEILEKICFYLGRGYGSVRSLYEEANKDGAGVALQYVKDWVKKQTRGEIMRIMTVFRHFMLAQFIA